MRLFLLALPLICLSAACSRTPPSDVVTPGAPSPTGSPVAEGGPLAPPRSPNEAITPGAATVAYARAVQLMRADLQSYMAAQTSYRADSGSYASSGTRLGQRFYPTREVAVLVVVGNRTGHSAQATHVQHPGHSCTLAVGDGALSIATLKQRRTGAAGEVVCDDE